MDQEKVKTLILGAGPAGYTAAIYTARAGLAPLLYEGPQPGGQLVTTTEVENYPGFSKGILGPEIMESFATQATRFGAKIKSGSATNVDFSTPSELRITIDHKYTIITRTLIIATGASPKWLGLPAEKRLCGKGVSTSATCDGFFFRGEEVAVVGGGDSACEEAIHLANICHKVYLLVRKDKLRASNIMQKRLRQLPNIEILWNTEVEDIRGMDAVKEIKVINNHTNRKYSIPIKGLFIAIGHTPNTKIFIPHIKTNQMGYIQTIARSTQTNVPGVFAAGDVQDATYRQAITAAGSGCMAAIDAERYLTTAA